MSSDSRMKKSIKNLSFSMGGYFLTICLQLLNRLVFVKFLTAEYLGINGLFTNIISLLALSELGIGAAIVFAMYKPVANKETEKIKSLMALYKRLYSIIGWTVMAIGLSLTPFLQYLIKDMPDIKYIRVYYILYVLNSAISYFYNYKRSLIICNQDEYIPTTTTMLASAATKLVQILVLYSTRSFMLYLIVQVLFTRIENVVIAKIADQQYPFLKDKDVTPLNQEEKDSIRKNVLAMMIHKVGEIVLNATDNIVVSKFMGIVPVGLLSNYAIIFDMVSNLIGRVFSAVTPSLGNMVAVKDQEKSEQVFKRMFFANYWLIAFCTICLYCLIQPFVTIWLGEDYLLDKYLVLSMSACFYVVGMRRTVLMFRTVLGLFWNDRYKPLVESAMNLAISIPLTIHLGLTGVKLGTFISVLLTSFWVEGYILFKYYFKRSCVPYLLRQGGYALLTVMIGAMVQYMCGLVPSESIVGFLVKCVVCAGAVNLLFLALFFRKPEFLYYWNLILGFLKRKKH